MIYISLKIVYVRRFTSVFEMRNVGIFIIYSLLSILMLLMSFHITEVTIVARDPPLKVVGM